MSRGADLFVVCKNCGSEVSPYVTECQYCGQRVRKRAPKIERGGAGRGSRGRRAKPPRAPRLSKLRRDEIPGLRADPTLRPYVTIVLVAASFGVYLGAAANLFDPFDLMLQGVFGNEPSWHVFTAPFVSYSGGESIFAGGAYGFATMLAVGTFGWLLEKRHGMWAPALIYLLAGAGGMGSAMRNFTTGSASSTARPAVGPLRSRRMDSTWSSGRWRGEEFFAARRSARRRFQFRRMRDCSKAARRFACVGLLAAADLAWRKRDSSLG